MERIVFTYLDGYVRCEFGNAGYGDINIDFTFHGDMTVATPHDADFVPGSPQVDARGDASVHTWTSASVSWFFAEMVVWLEAVICNVRECAFEWDGEGPKGRLCWLRGVCESGRLKLTWTGTRTSAAAEREVRVNRAQMVRAFYEPFRGFVESDRYNPIGYEPDLACGDAFTFVLKGSDLDALVRAFVVRSRDGAHALFNALLERVMNRDASHPRALPLSVFIERAQVLVLDPPDWHCSVFPEAWDQWSESGRKTCLAKVFRSDSEIYGGGEKLRELRSERIEQWLAEQSRRDHDAPKESA